MSDEPINDTHPTTVPGAKPAKPRRRFPWISILGFLVLIALGLFGGYQSGLMIRQDAQATLVAQQLGEQFQLGLQDLEAGRYEDARQRFDYIIQNDPNYPGAAEKLAQAILMLSIPTATPTPTLTPTPDYSGAESIYNRARELMSVQDWAGVIGALDQLRKEDPNFHTAEVDGMYYISLRNRGVDLIAKEGNLEGGIYQLTLAERFAQLDGFANGLRDGARLYITGASFWEIDWSQAVQYFSMLASAWPNMWDSASGMTAAERFRTASIEYGDQLYDKEQYCDAYTQYANWTSALDEESARRANDAYYACYPPTEEPEPTEVATGEAPTEVPTEATTQ